MASVPWWRLALSAVVSAVLSAFVMELIARRGMSPLPVPVAIPVLLLVCAGGILVATRRVYRTVRGRAKRAVHPVTAFRVAVLATSALLAGPILAGWYLGQAFSLWPDLVGDRRATFFTALAAALAALIMSACGAIGRRWCRPPDGGVAAADPSARDDSPGHDR